MISRKHSLIGPALAGCLLLTGAGWALGQEERTPRDRPAPVDRREETRPGSTVPMRRLSAILGTTVQLQGGGTFGKVEDFVVNDNGCIEYVIIVADDRYVAVPFRAARIDFERRTFGLDLDRERLREVPTFTRDRYPDLSAGSEYRQRLDTFFRLPPDRSRPDRRLDSERREERRIERDGGRDTLPPARDAGRPPTPPDRPPVPPDRRPPDSDR
jgi:PRC-barrel domain